MGTIYPETETRDQAPLIALTGLLSSGLIGA